MNHKNDWFNKYFRLKIHMSATYLSIVTLLLILLCLFCVDYPTRKFVDHVSRGDLNNTKYWVNHGAKINDHDHVMVAAVKSGNMEMIQYLTTIGVKTNDSLSEAVKMNRLDIVICLVDKGADIYANNGLPMKLACAYGFINIVYYLKDIEYDINSNQGAALYIAAKNGHTDIVHYLVNSGADVHASNDIALEVTQYEYPDIAIFLITQGSRIELSYFSHVNITKYLVNNGLYDKYIFGNAAYDRYINTNK